jgi:hypothetical protein
MSRSPFTDDQRTWAALKAAEQVAATLRARRESDAER